MGFFDMPNIIPESYALAIGEMVLAASKLDSILTDLLAIWAQTDILSAVIAFSHSQPTSKIDTLLALYQLPSSSDEIKSGDEVTRLLKRLRDLFDYRNTIIHAHWTVNGDGTISSVRFSARGQFKRSKKPVSVEDIRAHVAEMHEVEATLRSLRDHMHSVQDQEAMPR